MLGMIIQIQRMSFQKNNYLKKFLEAVKIFVKDLSKDNYDKYLRN